MALLPWLRLLRIGTLFSPAADGTAGLCLVQAGWNAEALRIVLAGVCLYAGGMVLNDFADRREDAVQRPERPLPRGEIKPAAALALGSLLLATGCVISPVPWWHAAMAALVLGYDFVFKHSPLGGAVTMGLLRAANLAAPAAAMALPAGAFPAVTAAAAAYALYIVAVTLLGILEDAAAPSPPAVRALMAVPPLGTVTALCIVQRGIWPAPSLACVAIACFALVNLRQAHFDQRTIRIAMRWLLLGTMVYTSLLCVACDRLLEAAVIAAAIVPARLIARAIALT